MAAPLERVAGMVRGRVVRRRPPSDLQPAPGVSDQTLNTPARREGRRGLAGVVPHTSAGTSRERISEPATDGRLVPVSLVLDSISVAARANIKGSM